MTGLTQVQRRQESSVALGNVQVVHPSALLLISRQHHLVHTVLTQQLVETILVFGTAQHRLGRWIAFQLVLAQEVPGLALFADYRGVGILGLDAVSDIGVDALVRNLVVQVVGQTGGTGCRARDLGAVLHIDHRACVVNQHETGEATTAADSVRIDLALHNRLGDSQTLVLGQITRGVTLLTVRGVGVLDTAPNPLRISIALVQSGVAVIANIAGQTNVVRGTVRHTVGHLGVALAILVAVQVLVRGALGALVQGRLELNTISHRSRGTLREIVRNSHHKGTSSTGLASIIHGLVSCAINSTVSNTLELSH